MEVFWDFEISPGNGIREGWNDEILVFKRILTILILSSLPPVAEPLISPRRRRYPYEPEANIASSQNPLFHCSIIPIVSEAN
jgi:hypothetical protein